MPKDGYKGLRIAASLTKEWLLWSKDYYTSGLRNISKGWHRDETHERVGRFRIGWTHKEICVTWEPQMEKQTPKIGNFVKK